LISDFMLLYFFAIIAKLSFNYLRSYGIKS
jgi:hypothetical protein